MSDAEKQETGSPRKRRLLTRLVIVAIIAVVLVGIVVALLPTLVSTGPGRRALVGFIDRQIPGSLEVQEVKLGWFSGQAVHGLTLKDPQGQVVASDVSVDAPGVSLFGLMFGSQQLGDVSVQANEINVTQQPGDRTNLQQAVSGAKEADEGESPPAAKPKPKSEPTGGEMVVAIGKELSAKLSVKVKRITYSSPDIEPVEVSNLDAQVDLVEPQTIGLTVQSDLTQAGQTGRIDVKVNVQDAFDASGKAQFNAAQIDARALLQNIPLAAIDRLANQNGRLASLFGPQLDATVEAQGPLRQLNARITGKSAHLREMDVQLTSDEQAIRAQRSTIQLEVVPEAFERWTVSPGQTAPARLVEPVIVNITLAALNLPQHEQAIDWANASLDVAVDVSPMLLDTEQRGRVAMRNTAINVQTQQLASQLQAQLRGDLEVQNVQQPVHLTAVVYDLTKSDVPLRATLAASATPLVLVDVVAGLDGKLVTTLGDTLDANLDLVRQQAGDLTFAGRLQSPRLRGPFEGSYGSDGSIAFRTPSPLELTVTPDAFAAWVATESPQRLALQEPMLLRANVRQLELALLDGGEEADAEGQAMRLDPERSKLFADVSIPLAVLRDVQEQATMRIEQVDVSFEGTDLRDVVQVLANLRVTSQSDRGAEQPEPGSVSSRTQIRGLLSDDGRVQWRQAQIRSDTQVQALPSILVDSLLGKDGQLAAILGRNIAADMNVQMTPGAAGTVKVDLQADNTKGLIDGRISQAGELTLNEPAILSVGVTPDVSRAMLQKVNPFLIQAVSADQPMQLVVESQGFVLPLKDFDLARVSANASLDIGVLKMNNGGLIKLLMNVLRRDKPGQLVASFTPMHASMDQGVLNYRDMVMTLDNIVLGFAGNVDFHRNYMDLLMTMPREALERIFNVAESLPPSYTLQIPVAGPIGSASPDFNVMSREITKLAARSAIQKNVGGEAGEAVGGLLDIILGGDSQQAPADSNKPDSTEPKEGQEQTKPPTTQPESPLGPLFDLLRQPEQDKKGDESAKEQSKPRRRSQ